VVTGPAACPHPEQQHHPRGSLLKLLGQTTPAVSTLAIGCQEETSLETTATPSTPPIAVREVDATHVASRDTSLRSVL
jgi:hypothetical protein